MSILPSMQNCPTSFLVKDDCCEDTTINATSTIVNSLIVDGVKQFADLTFAVISAPWPTSPTQLVKNTGYYVDISNVTATGHVFYLPSVADSTLGDTIFFEQTTDQTPGQNYTIRPVDAFNALTNPNGAWLRKTSSLMRTNPALGVGPPPQGPHTQGLFGASHFAYDHPSSSIELTFFSVLNGSGGKGSKAYCQFLSELDNPTVKGQWHIEAVSLLHGQCNVNDTTTDFY